MTSLVVLNRRLNSLREDLSHREDILVAIRNCALRAEDSITTPDYGTTSVKEYVLQIEKGLLETFSSLKGTYYENRARWELTLYGLWPVG